MGSGKIIAIIGAIVGILSVLLGLFLPELFSWYRLDIPGGGLYLTGFGTNIADPSPSPIDEIAILALIGGILVIVGAIACLASAFTENKIFGLLGGLLMIVGPLLLLVDIMTGMSEFMEFMELFTGGESGAGLLFDSYSPAPGVTFSWGIWIGFFMGIGGGVVGLIGGALVER